MNTSAPAGIRPRASQQPSRTGLAAAVLALAGCVLALSGVESPAEAAPAIRIAPGSDVPACVTPERLMEFLRSRNPRVEPRFSRIAHEYKRHGQAWRVRWDYAFYQMAIETNFLSFRRPDGRFGDVRPSQNNFAGLGTTGGGVPGDSYPDVSTGVLAQIQHLVVYAGESIASPVGHRTRLKQDVILRLSQPIAERRPVTYQDLSGRWAVDRAYGRSIEWVATQFVKNHCPEGVRSVVAEAGPRSGPPAAIANARPVGALGAATAAPVSAARQPATAKGGPGPGAPRTCRIQAASFGGSRAVLVRATGTGAGVDEITVLEVLPGFERELAEGFIRQYAPGATIAGTYNSRRDAEAAAAALCPVTARS